MVKVSSFLSVALVVGFECLDALNALSIWFGEAPEVQPDYC